MVSSILLVIISPKGWPGPDGEGGAFGFYDLNNPGIVSIPLGFLACYLGSILSGEEKKAEREFEELYVRSETGLEAEGSEEAERRAARKAERADDSGRVPRLRPGRTTPEGIQGEESSGSQHGDSRRTRAGNRGAHQRETFDPPEEFVRERADLRRVGPRGGGQGPRRLVGRAGQGPALVRGAHRGARRLQPAVLQVVRGRQARTRPTTAWTATSRRATATASR